MDLDVHVPAIALGDTRSFGVWMARADEAATERSAPAGTTPSRAGLGGMMSLDQKAAPMEPTLHEQPMPPWLVLALVAISLLIWWLAR